MAFGALHALRAAGRGVPDDVAVVGFDDVVDSAFTDPPLTTVRQPLEEMTSSLTQLLLRRMEGLATDDDFVVCETELIVRASG
jgi:DNA-binding LacI/PurR family transcriptional regulator